MKSTRASVIVIVSVLFALVVCAGLVLSWLRDPIRVAERALGISLPHRLKQIAHEEKSGPLGVSGFSFSVYQLPEKIRGELMSRCKSMGIQRGRLSDQQIDLIMTAERYIDPNADSCYAFKSSGMNASLVVMSGDKLVIYWDY